MILTVDKYHCEGIFDHTGGELQIPSYGFTLSIPPGALPEGSSETITLDVLKDIPPAITLRPDETLLTYGFQCLPSGLQFVSEKPVRLKIPHCANLIDPTKVQVVLYFWNHGKAMWSRNRKFINLSKSEEKFDFLVVIIPHTLQLNGEHSSQSPFYRHANHPKLKASEQIPV